MPSDAPPADKIAVLEAVDGFAPMRNGLRRIASDMNEYAGIPMPIEGLPLRIEPTYRKAAGLMEINRQPPDPEDAGIVWRNDWWSTRKLCRYLIWQTPEGKIEWGLDRGSRLMMDLNCLLAADAWGIEQEAAAVQTLGRMLRHRNYKQYLLTGQFVETSKRSGVMYMFRRLKPTVAIRPVPGKDGKLNLRVLCAMCMHPIGYYEDTWAGAMTPTDDVIAHLAMMRADEVMFWRRSNQHSAYRPMAAL